MRVRRRAAYRFQTITPRGAKFQAMRNVSQPSAANTSAKVTHAASFVESSLLYRFATQELTAVVAAGAGTRLEPRYVSLIMTTFVLSGIVFAVVGGLCAAYLSNPPAASEAGGAVGRAAAASTERDFTPAEAMRAWQFYALWLMLFLNVTAGILFISNAVPIMRDGQLKLIECNHRFTAAIELVRASGLDLALFTYNRLLGRPPPEIGPQRDGTRLWLAVGVIFAVSLSLLRVALRRKPLPEEAVVAPAVQRVDYLR